MTIDGQTTIKSVKVVHEHDSGGKYLWFEKKASCARASSDAVAAYLTFDPE